MIPSPDAVLCFVESCEWSDGGWAFFTTAPLEQQWGDDWNDAPYEHNAGRPYKWREGMTHRGEEVRPYTVSLVAWVGPFSTPDEGQTNSPWSVQAINAGACAWLDGSRYHAHHVNVPAGVTFKEFRRLVESAGGRVFVAIEHGEDG